MNVELLFVLVLIVANGVFALAEIAIVSARPSRLGPRADAGDRGAAAALALKARPDEFLATVQVGITLIGVLTGAFGGATLAEQLAGWLSQFPAVAPYREPLSLAAVVSAITYLSLVVGELVPKRLALNDPDRYAVLLALPLQKLARLSTPAVALLSGSTTLLTRLLGMRPDAQPVVTEEELRGMIRQGTEEGLLEVAEREMVEGVFRLGDRRVGSLATPRPELEWLDADLTETELRQVLATHQHSRLPVCEGSPDHILGVVSTRQLLLQFLAGEPLKLRDVMDPALFIPESASAVAVLETFRTARQPFAVVIDEHGGTHGVVTLTDLLEAIVGDLPEPTDAMEAGVVQREDGSWLVDGATPLDELRDRLRLPFTSGPDYTTLGGLVSNHLGHIPVAGESFDLLGFRFEVMDMDGLRVDKVLISPQGT